MTQDEFDTKAAESKALFATGDYNAADAIHQELRGAVQAEQPGKTTAQAGDGTLTIVDL